MDVIDFHRWLNDLSRKFPATRAWLREIEPAADRDALIDSWQLALRDCELAACLAANQRMVSGELEGPGLWPANWQGLAALVRRYAIAIAAEEADESPRTQRDNREHRRTVLVRQRLKEGAPRERISAELVAAGYEGIATTTHHSPREEKR